MLLKKIATWGERFLFPDETAKKQYDLFLRLLREDRRCIRSITRLEEIAHRPVPADWTRIVLLARILSSSAERLVDCLEKMRPNAYPQIRPAYDRLRRDLSKSFPESTGKAVPPYALSLDQAFDCPELVGNKAFGLARILKRTRIPAPRGFVATINAFYKYLEENDLRGYIDKQLQLLDLQRPERLGRVSAKLEKAILEGSVPSEVRKSISAMLEKIDADADSILWAVRSSAAGEDGEISFAGQYETLLDVSRKDIFAAYKTVLAGKYSVKAMTYRLHYGIADVEAPMAALFCPMIRARTSGVVYTLDPLDMCGGKCLVVSAVSGLGGRLVDGGAVPDIFLVSRQDPTRFIDKPPDSGKKTPDSPGAIPKDPEQFCLDENSAVALAKWGLELEALAGSPQDIEWAEDQDGKLHILQSRPIPTSLGKTDEIDSKSPALSPAKHDSPLLLKGTPASKGIAAGAVCRISGETEMGNVPRDGILATRSIPPSLVGIVKMVGAVIAESGSAASHFASVAREFGLPVVVGLGDTSKILEEGRVVTVDAYGGAVYDGVVEELVSWNERHKEKKTSRFQERLASLLPKVASLNLTDPASPEFSPQGCRSFHDLVRFVHEMGVREMFSLVEIDGPGMRRAKHLDTDVPILMYVLDLGGGLDGHARTLKAIAPKHFKSTPMRAVWAGLTDREVSWSKGLLHMDWNRFDQVAAGIGSLKSSRLGSYALVAKHYAHLLLRFGYHFAVLDTMSGDRADENYIQFRFKGGGGDPEKKTWRLAMIERVLQGFDFRVKIREDLLEAWCKRMDREANELRLEILGYLLGRTPLLDMALDSRENAFEMAGEMLDKWRTKKRNP